MGDMSPASEPAKDKRVASDAPAKPLFSSVPMKSFLISLTRTGWKRQNQKLEIREVTLSGLPMKILKILDSFSFLHYYRFNVKK